MGENLQTSPNLFALAISDLHLGHVESDVDSFKKLLQEFFVNRIVKNFILLGDIFDLWRRDNIQVVKDHAEILRSLIQLVNNGKIAKIHFVIGNHDYTIQEVLISLKGNSDAELANIADEIEKLVSTNKLQFYGGKLSKATSFLTLPFNAERKFFFIHGHNLEWSGILTDDAYEAVLTGLCSADNTTGPILDAIWKGITFFTSHEGSPLLLRWRIISILLGKWVAKRLVDDMEAPAEERSTLKNILLKEYRREEVFNSPMQSEAEKAIMELARIFVNFDPETQYLIFGHTHQSGKGTNISNAGCWYKSKKDEERLLIINTEGEVSIHKFQ
jgi:UDP-2,3-diacylglucosamine pyrophosphatase LpxH